MFAYTITTTFHTSINFVNFVIYYIIKVMLSTTIDLSSLLSFQIGVVSSFFLISGLVFLTLFKENKLQIVLGAVLLFWGVLIAKDELYLSHVIPKTDFLYKILLTIDLWVTPCCAIYALELLRPNWINSKYIMVNFIPFVLFTLLFTVTHKIIWYHIGIFYTIIYSLIILCFLIYRIFDYRRRMLNQFSSLTNIDIKWFVRIIIVLLICLASWVFVYFQNNYLIDICYYFMLLFIWGYISYYTKLQYVPKSEELDY